MGILCKLDRTGHGAVAKWGDDAESRGAAAKAFADLVERGFMMFDVTHPQAGRKLDAFDPAAAEIIATPRMQAG